MKQKKNLIWKCLAVLPLLGLAACTGNDEPSAPPATQQGKAEITLMVDAGVSETRSTPDDPDETTLEGVQHVKNVSLYIFRHDADGVKYVGRENADWSSLTVVSGEDEKTQARTYTVTANLQASTTYTLLATGYENEEIYLLGTLTAENPVELDELISTLKDGKGKTDIQTNEYFTGSLEVTTEGDGQFPEGTTVEMHRRVAGLSTCFKIGEASFSQYGKKPAYVAVMLYTNQKKAVPTLEQIWQEPNFTDYAKAELEDATDATGEALSQCLMWLNVSQSGNTETSDGEGTEQGASDATKSVEDTRLYNERNAIYLLPIPAPEFTDETNYTLAVAVYDTERKVICTKRAALAADGYLIFNTSLGTGIVDDELYYRYPIVANRFYRFGTEDAPMEIIYDPLKPFEVIVESTWEGMPDLDFTD